MIRAVLLVVSVAAVTACSPTADSFSVRRFGAYGAEFPPLERTVTDAAAAAHLYARVRSLPRDPGPPPDGFVSCPMDLGLRYEITFFARGERLLHGVLTRGCGGLDLGAGDHRIIDDSFWAELAGDLGYYTRGNDLFPTPIPGH